LYFLRGIGDNLTTVTILAQVVARSRPASANDLRDHYFEYLAAIQPDIWRPRPPIRDDFYMIVDEEGVDQAASEADIQSDLPAVVARRGPRGITPLADFAPDPWKTAILRSGSDRIQVKAPELYELFKLVAPIVRTSGSSSPRAGSLTTSHAVGVVWVYPSHEWSGDDTAEAMVHELTHNLIFLDDHRFGHVKNWDLAFDPAYWSLSAIRKDARPLHAVFHSIVVGFELLEYRKRSQAPAPHLHANSQALSTSVLSAANQLLAFNRAPEVLSPRALELVVECRDRLDGSPPAI
jgi:hypothetical protein